MSDFDNVNLGNSLNPLISQTIDIISKLREIGDTVKESDSIKIREIREIYLKAGESLIDFQGTLVDLNFWEKNFLKIWERYERVVRRVLGPHY